MTELVLSGVVLALAGYLLTHRAPQRFPRSELPRYHRLSEEMRRNEIHPFE